MLTFQGNHNVVRNLVRGSKIHTNIALNDRLPKPLPKARVFQPLA